MFFYLCDVVSLVFAAVSVCNIYLYISGKSYIKNSCTILVLGTIPILNLILMAVGVCVLMWYSAMELGAYLRKRALNKHKGNVNVRKA